MSGPSWIAATSDANATTDACGELAAFSHEVDAQTGKKLGTAQSAALLTQAQGTEAALGC